MSHWRTSASVLGKVPWRDEFLRASGLPSELRSLDEWLFRNAHAALAIDSVAAGGRAPASYGFLMKLIGADDALHAVAGVLSPSHDRAGRAYPLAVAAPVTLATDVDAHPEIAPIVLESYWRVAVDVLSAVQSAPLTTDDRSLERLTEGPLESGESALNLYGAWARQTAVEELCSLLERSFEWLASAAKGIVGLVAPPGRFIESAHAPAIRVPLGHAAGGALCFWLDLLRRAARPGRAPSFFWSHDGETGDALLCLGAPTETTLAALWHLEAAGGTVSDFTRPDLVREGSAPSAGADGSLASFLQRVEAQSIAFA
jgi:type VI secretion system ImpM family protein